MHTDWISTWVLNIQIEDRQRHIKTCWAVFAAKNFNSWQSLNINSRISYLQTLCSLHSRIQLHCLSLRNSKHFILLKHGCFYFCRCLCLPFYKLLIFSIYLVFCSVKYWVNVERERGGDGESEVRHPGYNVDPGRPGALLSHPPVKTNCL